MSDVNTKLTVAYQKTLNLFINAVSLKRPKAAAMYREELHSVIDLQLDDLMKQIKKQNGGAS